MHGELLEAERGETLHMVEVVREAAEARAALQSREAELAQWREAAEGAQASNAMMAIELEARREAEAEQAAARAELRAEQLRLRQANAQMHALLGRLRARLGEGDEAPEAPDEAPAKETNVALVARLQDYVARGLDPTEEIRKNRDFHNPMLLEKIVRYYDIDDIASQFPKHLFDPEAIVARRSKGKKQAPSSPRADTSAPMTALPLPPAPS